MRVVKLAQDPGVAISVLTVTGTNLVTAITLRMTVPLHD